MRSIIVSILIVVLIIGFGIIFYIKINRDIKEQTKYSTTLKTFYFLCQIGIVINAIIPLITGIFGASLEYYNNYRWISIGVIIILGIVTFIIHHLHNREYKARDKKV